MIAFLKNLEITIMMVGLKFWLKFRKQDTCNNVQML